MLVIDNAEHVGKFYGAIRYITDACERYEWDDGLKEARDNLIAAAQSMAAHMRNRGKKQRGA